MDRKTEIFRSAPSVYYTSLTESVDRRDYMNEQLTDWNVPSQAYITDRFDDLDITITGPHTDQLSSGEKGTISSHIMNIYKWYHTTNERYALFCEDDIDFDTCNYWSFTWEEFILSLPKNWKMVQLLRINPFNSMDYKEEQGIGIRKRNWCDWGCHFILTREAAKELIDKIVVSDGDSIHLHLEPEYNLHPMPENVLYSHFVDYLDTVYSVPLFVENLKFATTFNDAEEIDPATGAKLDQAESSVFYHNKWHRVGKSTSIDAIMGVSMPEWEYVVNRDRLDEEAAEKEPEGAVSVEPLK